MSHPAKALHIGVEVDADGCTLVHPAGHLDATTYGQLRDLLLKCAADVPVALLVNIAGLSVESSSPLTVFAAVWVRTAAWPGVPIALYGELAAGAGFLAASQVSRFVPVHPDLASAKRAARAQPLRRRATLDLPWTRASSAAARRFVSATCGDWDLPREIIDDAKTVMTELVDNTLRHTHAEPCLRLELRRGMLTVAVSDNDPATAGLHKEDIEAHGMGLRLVAHLSTAWGCTPTADGGKIVWAVLRTPGPVR